MSSGKNPLYLPPYTNATPVECFVRCACGLRYLIFTGNDEASARARAVEMGVTFIDARVVPFMNCECGELLDFTGDEGERVM